MTDPADLPDADVVVIPGSKATVADLGWLRERGLADGIAAHAAAGRPVLGICGGFQMLCRRIDDPVESRRGRCRRPRSARRRHRVRAGQDIASPRRTAARLRDPPRAGGSIRRRRLARRRNPATPRCTARTGTACWTTTRCGGAGLPTPRGRRAAWLHRRRRRRRRRRGATRQLDLMADLLAASVDIDAVLALLDERPAGQADDRHFDLAASLAVSRAHLLAGHRARRACHQRHRQHGPPRSRRSGSSSRANSRSAANLPIASPS